MPRYKLRIDGPEGKIETVVDDPGPERRGLALIAHPHPQHGGSLNNKVVTTLAKTLHELGYVAVRPNFRGVGQSEGHFDQGRGEVEDLLATLVFVREHYPDLELLLAGFSFGAVMQTRLSLQAPASQMILVAPAVNLFEMGPIAPATQVIHGERDELVPLELVQAWAAQEGIGINVVPQADHFFNRKLNALNQLVTAFCQ